MHVLACLVEVSFGSFSGFGVISLDIFGSM